VALCGEIVKVSKSHALVVFAQFNVNGFAGVIKKYQMELIHDNRPSPLSLPFTYTTITFTKMRHRRQKSRLYAERIELINEAIEKNDVTELRQLAMSGPGLVNNGLRQKAW
jgi:hypothetical protein